MGYACPVCGAHVADAEHLANHVAFTAMLRGGDHESYLDDHAPDWGDRDPASLGEELAADAAEVETDSDHGSGGSDSHVHGDALEDAVARQGGGRGRQRGGGTPADVLEEARDMTREMYGLEDEAGADADATDGESGDGESGDGTGDSRGGESSSESGTGSADETE